MSSGPSRAPISAQTRSGFGGSEGPRFSASSFCCRLISSVRWRREPLGRVLWLHGVARRAARKSPGIGVDRDVHRAVLAEALGFDPDVHDLRGRRERARTPIVEAEIERHSERDQEVGALQRRLPHAAEERRVFRGQRSARHPAHEAGSFTRSRNSASASGRLENLSSGADDQHGSLGLFEQGRDLVDISRRSARARDGRVVSRRWLRRRSP